MTVRTKVKLIAAEVEALPKNNEDVLKKYDEDVNDGFVKINEFLEELKGRVSLIHKRIEGEDDGGEDDGGEDDEGEKDEDAEDEKYEDEGKGVEDEVEGEGEDEGDEGNEAKGEDGVEDDEEGEDQDESDDPSPSKFQKSWQVGE